MGFFCGYVVLVGPTWVETAGPAPAFAGLVFVAAELALGASAVPAVRVLLVFVADIVS